MIEQALEQQYETWLVLATHTHREAVAIENLKQQGYVTYLPLVMKHIRHARRAYDAPRPLFPGYVFVERPQPPKRWKSLQSTFGVRNVLMCGGAFASLPPGFVEGLKAREVNGFVCKPLTALNIGQQVSIQGGAFDGLIGQIIELRDNERVIVLLNILNQRTRVHINATQVL
jgi:transcriptional antiterminator RfaH